MEKFNLITNSAVELGDDLGIETNGKGRKFISRFIEAGVAHYEQFGDVLITKETLDKFIHTMIGCPVIIKHKDITDKNADKERVGVVSDVWYNQNDGYFYCSGIIWDKQAIDLVKNQGWNVSCTYDFESDKQEKTHNGKKIDMEFTDGNFLHLALVDNPRYERANIVMNSKEKNDDIEWITVKGNHIPIKKGQPKDEAVKEWIEKWEDKDKLVTVEKADEETIKKNKETNDRWQKAIKETAKKEGWDKEDKKEKFETHYIIWQKNGNPYILDKLSFENWKENNKEHISTSDIDTITHTDIEKFKDDLKARGIDIKEKGGQNYIISQIADLRKEQKKSHNAQNAFETGLNSILDDYKPVREDLPILNGLKDILR